MGIAPRRATSRSIVSIGIMFTALSVAAALIGTTTALKNGVGKLPKMGYDGLNAFDCAYNQSSVMAQVDFMVKSGLVAAGYNSVLLDDCFTLKQRSSDGSLVADPKKWPHGMKNFTDSIKAKGVSASAYSDSGMKTCQGYPGTWDHEVQDLNTWLEWGFDYLKVCASARSKPVSLWSGSTPLLLTQASIRAFSADSDV